MAGSHTHTHTHCKRTCQLWQHTLSVWEREIADLAGSALETESSKPVRTPAKQQQQQRRSQQHPVVATAAAVHTGARHQRIPVNMQQQCVAPIQTLMHIIHAYVYACVCVHIRKRKSQAAGVAVVQQKSKQLADVDCDVSVAPALSRPRKSCACV